MTIGLIISTILMQIGRVGNMGKFLPPYILCPFSVSLFPFKLLLVLPLLLLLLLRYLFQGRSRACQGGESGHARNQTEKRVELMRGRLKLLPEGSLNFEWSAAL